MTLMIPTVNLNGTNGDDLVRQLTDAINAIDTAERLVAACGPHGRDYYLQGPDAINRAVNHHADRLQRLRAVREDLEQIAIGVIKQDRRRA